LLDQGDSFRLQEVRVVLVGGVLNFGAVDRLGPVMGRILRFDGPVKGNAVQVFDGVEEVVGVLLANIFDAKVVDDQGEGDWTGMIETVLLKRHLLVVRLAVWVDVMPG
jgi:hypothetical protein